MLNRNNFNKLGGTEFRVANQIKSYTSLFYWIIDEKIKVNNKSEGIETKEIEEKFRDWAIKEDLYNYRSKDKIKRFKMILGNLLKDFKIIKKSNDGHYVSNIKSNDLSLNTFFLHVYENFGNSKNNAFKSMVDFIILNKNRKLNAEKIALAFFVHDGNESFSELYEKEDIVNILTSNWLKDKENKNLEEVIKFRKPPTYFHFYNNIFQKKKNLEEIVLSDFTKFDYLVSKDKYLKNIFFNKNKKFSLIFFIKSLNEISYNDLIFKFNYKQIERLLKDDYKDLLFRWLFGFKLLKSSSKKENIIITDHLGFVNKKPFIKENTSIEKYPFSKEKVLKYLKLISNLSFEWKNKIDDLQNINNSTLAEYFVNLFWAYELNILPKNFTKYSKTKVDEYLFPIFTAPGGTPDFSFQDENRNVIVETTLLKDLEQIKRNEFFQILKHSTYEKTTHKRNSTKLIFVNPKKYKTFIKLLWIHIKSDDTYKILRTNFNIEDFTFESLLFSE